MYLSSSHWIRHCLGLSGSHFDFQVSAGWWWLPRSVSARLLVVVTHCVWCFGNRSYLGYEMALLWGKRILAFFSVVFHKLGQRFPHVPTFFSLFFNKITAKATLLQRHSFVFPKFWRFFSSQNWVCETPGVLQLVYWMARDSGPFEGSHFVSALLRMPVHELSHKARDGPIGAICSGLPSKDGARNRTCLKDEIVTETTSMPVHQLGVLEVNHVLFLIIRCKNETGFP